MTSKRGRVLRPECEFDEHRMCHPEEVRTPTRGVLVFPAKRCDCACHNRKRRGRV
ncbi:hypothetical protein [Streptomyces sp. NPDC094049]|uniref:hypothetical protein n=1 Tax=Streptomyces sp. NPDC094049 TaxID=3154987 RepID=UPI00331D4C44